jgi:deoxyribodipyrimidine photolyase-like uncharacterized protein
MKEALVIFPHQLFDPHPGLSQDRMEVLSEDSHFFVDPGRPGIESLVCVLARLFDHAYLQHWFMELFIDAYDWVMVPNFYGMSQFADSGRITTRPYISSSRYILRMSDYTQGEWCPIWDGLYWRFIHKNLDFFAGNPRMRMMAVQWECMDQTKRREHLEKAESYLASL